MQTTSRILMIRPLNFSFNTQTASTNAFQVRDEDQDVQERARNEFDQFTSLLKNEGVEVTILDDTAEPQTPDSIFPNNWISLHEDGTVCLYPMHAPNRRLERKPHILSWLAGHYDITSRIDLSGFEDHQLYLEGTGSMVLDRTHRIAYACLSPRTDIRVLERFCTMMKYRPVVFHATDSAGHPIYHTNVMMSVAEDFVILAASTIHDEREKNHLLQVISQSGKQLITITPEQMSAFAGNMLQVHNDKQEKLVVMSSRAFEALLPEQIEQISGTSRIIHAPLTTIEKNGGG
ncbi:MAG: amidinotransferase, partial [Chitinophagaceae bacterium]